MARRPRQLHVGGAFTTEPAVLRAKRHAVAQAILSVQAKLDRGSRRSVGIARERDEASEAESSE